MFPKACADPAVPSWDVSRGALGLEDNVQELRVYTAGLKDGDQHLVVRRAWPNLREEARHAVRRLDPEKFRIPNCIDLAIAAFGERDPDRSLRKLPRL